MALAPLNWPSARALSGKTVESVDEAYAVVEVLKGERGCWGDFRFLEVNHGFLNHTTMCLGRWARLHWRGFGSELLCDLGLVPAQIPSAPGRRQNLSREPLAAQRLRVSAIPLAAVPCIRKPT